MLVKDCNQCGKCCTRYGGDGGLSVTPEDIERWETDRPDIARYAADGKIWVDPDNGRLLDRCPWLEQEPGSKKYTCAIYFDRPGDCRYYPVDIEQMVRDDCEMLQPSDLRNIRRAQQSLDLLMSDSRPAVIK